MLNSASSNRVGPHSAGKHSARPHSARKLDHQNLNQMSQVFSPGGAGQRDTATSEAEPHARRSERSLASSYSTRSLACAEDARAVVRGLSLTVVLSGVVLALTAPVAAHDFWIEPTTYAPAIGTVVGIRARVGDGFLGDPVPRSADLLEALVVEDSAGRRPLVGRDGSDPAGVMRVAATGLHVVGYHGKPSRVELPADKFNKYLAEEGLERVAAARVQMKQSGAGARELFTRCAKTLVLAGDLRAGQHDRSLGCALELVAERNPYAMREGQSLPVRLTYDGQAVEGALVVAMNRQRPSEKVSARSDRDGRVRLLLPAGGVWLIKAVHMVPAPVTANADWASFWASLTFDLPARPVPPPAEATR